MRVRRSRMFPVSESTFCIINHMRACMLAVLGVLLAAAEAETASKPTTLQIGVKKRADTCEMKAENGDVLSIHFTVCLHHHPAGLSSERRRASCSTAMLCLTAASRAAHHSHSRWGAARY